MKYCRKCGEKIEDDVLCCPKCGHKKKKQNSMAEGAMYGAAGPTPAGTWTPVMTEERKRKIKKKRTLTAVGICACALLLACAAVLLWQFDVFRFAAQPEQETVLRKKDADAPTEEPPEEDMTEDAAEDTAEDVTEDVTENVPEEVPETAPETTTEAPPEEARQPDPRPEQGSAPSTEADPEDPSAVFRRIYAVHTGSYYVGETFNRNNLSVRAVYGTGWEKEVTDFTVAAPTFTEAGEHKITVSWGGKSCTVKVTVRPKPEEKQVAYITAMPKGTYNVGDRVQSKLMVKAHYTDGTSEQVYTYSLSVYELTDVGTQTVTVYYLGESCTVEVTVSR